MSVIDELIKDIECLDLEDKIKVLNDLRKKLHEISPFKNEPVDFIEWVKVDSVEANDYNPNTVAPPEMELLRHSIDHDGYTQPVVTWKDKSHREVIDGFHRTRVCKECDDVYNRVQGYLPVVTIKDGNVNRKDRIASTIRHNRARGKHNVQSMSDIVIELKKRNWSDERVAKELGMEPDEVLRLTQISGLTDTFKDREFSESWEYEEEDINEIEFKPDWPDSIRESKYVKGWNHKTDQHSYLSDGTKRLGSIQKSHFDDSWFWYAYTRPMTEGKAKDKEEAMMFIEGCFE